MTGTRYPGFPRARKATSRKCPSACAPLSRTAGASGDQVAATPRTDCTRSAASAARLARPALTQAGSPVAQGPWQSPQYSGRLGGRNPIVKTHHPLSERAQRRVPSDARPAPPRDTRNLHRINRVAPQPRPEQAQAEAQAMPSPRSPQPSRRS